MNRRLSTKEQKKLADDARLLRAWKKFHRDEYEAVLVGPHAAMLGELFRMLQNLKHVQPAQLIGLVRSIDWTAIDSNTKLVLLHELNSAIMKFRERRGAEPINDNLPGQPDTPFHTIKTIIFPHVTNVVPTEAQLGSNIQQTNTE
jgi:hypothetical protein